MAEVEENVSVRGQEIWSLEAGREVRDMGSQVCLGHARALGITRPGSERERRERVAKVGVPWVRWLLSSNTGGTWCSGLWHRGLQMASPLVE